MTPHNPARAAAEEIVREQSGCIHPGVAPEYMEAIIARHYAPVIQAAEFLPQFEWSELEINGYWHECPECGHIENSEHEHYAYCKLGKALAAYRALTQQPAERLIDEVTDAVEGR